MKKKGFLLGVLVVGLLLGLITVGCSNGSTDNGDGKTDGGSGGKGTLTINNFSGSGGVVITKGTPTSIVDLGNLISTPVAVGPSGEQPYKLVKVSDATVWNGTGLYLVVLTSGGQNYYMTDVSFKNGSATLDFNEMANQDMLPPM